MSIGPAPIRTPFPYERVEILNEREFPSIAIDPDEPEILHHRHVQHEPVVCIGEVIPLEKLVLAIVDVGVVIRRIHLALTGGDLVGLGIPCGWDQNRIGHDADALGLITTEIHHLDAIRFDGHGTEGGRIEVIKAGRGGGTRGGGVGIGAQRDAFGMAIEERIHAEGVIKGSSAVRLPSAVQGVRETFGFLIDDVKLLIVEQGPLNLNALGKLEWRDTDVIALECVIVGDASPEQAHLGQGADGRVALGIASWFRPGVPVVKFVDHIWE